MALAPNGVGGLEPRPKSRGEQQQWEPKGSWARARALLHTEHPELCQGLRRLQMGPSLLRDPPGSIFCIVVTLSPVRDSFEYPQWEHIFTL